MKFVNLFFIYLRFWWIVTVKVKSTKDELKVAAYYLRADELERKMYHLLDDTAARP